MLFFLQIVRVPGAGLLYTRWIYRRRISKDGDDAKRGQKKKKLYSEQQAVTVCFAFDGSTLKERREALKQLSRLAAIFPLLCER